MNKPTFTKGPWASEDNRDGVTEFYPKDRYPCMQPIASCYAKDVSEHAKEENRANARLIAAAPELFDALKAIYEIDVPDAEWSPTLEKCFGVALDAIAKVEGEK